MMAVAVLGLCMKNTNYPLRVKRGYMNIPDYLEPILQEALGHMDNYYIEKNTPFVIYKAKVFQDGDQFCALLGDNIQEGICAFGDTPAQAVSNFNIVWYKSIKTRGITS